MPPIVCAEELVVPDDEVERLKDNEGRITRESVEQWLTTHSGDFQEVMDFSASIEDGPDTVEVPWRDEESECTYMDCMFGTEE